MITIIIVSVLSTLGAVALVGSIVVVFKKLNKKVDVVDFEITNTSIYKAMDDGKKELNEQISEIYRLIGQNNEEIWKKIDENERETYRTIDSRCDKLDAKISTSVPKKELIKG